MVRQVSPSFPHAMYKKVLLKALGMVRVSLAALVLYDGRFPSQMGVGCKLVARSGLSIEVVDAVAGTPLEEATGIATDGPDLEPLQNFRGRLLGAIERPGRYDISITAPGHQAWARTEVWVRRAPGPCHGLQPTRLQAQLVRD
jgi:hypothetical protein